MEGVIQDLNIYTSLFFYLQQGDKKASGTSSKSGEKKEATEVNSIMQIY